MTLRIAPKPTVYRGIRFRSRLEAQWAYVFDQLMWRWRYEPIDLLGYVPDFILYGTDDNKVFVEVKPSEIYKDNRRTIIRKAKNAGIKELLVLCENAQISECWGKESARIGTFEYIEEHGWGFENDGAILNRHYIDSSNGEKYVRHFQGYDISAEYGSYAFRLSGVYEGDHHLNFVPQDEFEACWRSATEFTKWEPA